MARISTAQFRLNQPAYEALEKQLPKPLVSNTTTDIQAGYSLGIQHVLSLLREGFVVQS